MLKHLSNARIKKINCGSPLLFKVQLKMWAKESLFFFCNITSLTSNGDLS